MNPDNWLKFSVTQEKRPEYAQEAKYLEHLRDRMAMELGKTIVQAAHGRGALRVKIDWREEEAPPLFTNEEPRMMVILQAYVERPNDPTN